jgi:predicted naringenin-chalcone synthase
MAKSISKYLPSEVLSQLHRRNTFCIQQENLYTDLRLCLEAIENHPIKEGSMAVPYDKYNYSKRFTYRQFDKINNLTPMQVKLLKQALRKDYAVYKFAIDSFGPRSSA